MPYEIGQTVWVLAKEMIFLGHPMTMSRRRNHPVPFLVVETIVKFVKIGPEGKPFGVFVQWWEDDKIGGLYVIKEFPPHDVYIDEVAAHDSRRALVKNLLLKIEDTVKFEGNYQVRGL